MAAKREQAMPTDPDPATMTDLELNAAVAKALGWKRHDMGFVAIGGQWNWESPLGTGHNAVPRYSTDLNEAVKLPGFFQLAQIENGEAWESEFVYAERGGDVGEVSVAADSPARAVCLAYLKSVEARDAQ